MSDVAATRYSAMAPSLASFSSRSGGALGPSRVRRPSTTATSRQPMLDAQETTPVSMPITPGAAMVTATGWTPRARRASHVSPIASAMRSSTASGSLPRASSGVCRSAMTSLRRSKAIRLR